ncbi:MAG: hypothetical protein MUE56_09950 [Ignavibacteria bacterium]|nr:hypothetical protein [Ignavibacteria bacterium]
MPKLFLNSTNYIGFLRKALYEAGFKDIPVISISANGIEDNGIKWEGPLKSVSGDVGLTSTSGLKKIIWDVLNERDIFAGEKIVFRVNAKLLDFSLTDSRDGTTYKAVIIGDYQWMGENLNFKTPSGSWIYNDDPDNAGKYGRLYDWTTARTACPLEWHLPSDNEWRDLISNIGGLNVAGSKLKSKKGWDGSDSLATDDILFNALPGGFRDNSGKYKSAGINAGFWSSTSYNSENAIYIFLYNNFEHANMLSINKSVGLSVRCVKRDAE